jgi:hypothetical protein
MLAQLWPFLWGWVRPSTHPTLSIACIYRLPLWRRMLACLQANSTKSTPGIVCCCFQLSGCLLPPSLVPVISHYIIGRSSQPLFSSLRTGSVLLSFPFLLPPVFCLDVWLPILFPVICNAPDSSRLKTSLHPTKTWFTSLPLVLRLSHANKSLHNAKKETRVKSTTWAHAQAHTCDCTNAKEMSYRRRFCSCTSAHYSFISRATKCCGA